MGNLILVFAVVVILAASVLFALLRGLAKSRIRGICILASAFLAVLATLTFKGRLTSEAFTKEILPWLEAQNMGQVKEFLEISPTLNEVILNCITSLVAPLFCLLLFLVLFFITWIVYLVLTLALGGPLRRHNEQAKFRFSRALIWGAVQGIVIVMILLLPVSAYIEIAPDAIDAVLETGIIDEESAEVVQSVLDDTVRPMDEKGVLPVYRVLGGNGMTCLLTDFQIGEQKTHLADEIDSVAAFACNIVRLTQTKFTEYSSDEAVVFVAIADSFEESLLLPAIAGEVVYGATDAWLNGRAFIGIEKPLSGGEMGDLTSDFFDSLLRILHADSRNYPALQADIRTVADMVATLATNEVFADINNPEALLTTLGKNGIVKKLVVSVGENSSMKVMIPEITNMGVQAFASVLEIPADQNEVYQAFLADVVDTMNYVSQMPSEESRIMQISRRLKTAFGNADVECSSELIDCYSISLSRDLLPLAKTKALTAQDVQAFFKLYALAAEGDGALQSAVGRNEFKGTVYADLSYDSLKAAGAVRLARVMDDLSSLENSEDFDANVTAIVLRAYSETEESTSETAMLLKKVKLPMPISADLTEELVSLKALDTFQTQIVTLEDLLIDAEEAANKITSNTIQDEAEAIDSIFGSLGGLTDSLQGSAFSLDSASGAIGTVLDSLHTSQIYGADRTAKLFTAVLQAKMLRDTAKLSLSTATEMAGKATEGDVNYTATLKSIASSVKVLTELGESGKRAEKEDLVELIDNLNPQSAGMLETYVTPDRIEEYGVSSKYADTSSDLLTSTFGYMAENELEDSEAEAEALNHVLDIAISANSHSSGQQLFSDGEREGILPSATETVNTLMASQSVTHSLRENLLDESGNVIEEKQDAFDLGRKIPEESAEYQEFIGALDSSYQANPTEETKQTLTALAALFGVVYR